MKAAAAIEPLPLLTYSNGVKPYVGSFQSLREENHGISANLANEFGWRSYFDFVGFIHSLIAAETKC